MEALPPTPSASNQQARRAMVANRRTDTRPETELRGALHRAGCRFRKDYRLNGTDGVSTRADIVFPRQRVAVFVDGCFWHGCALHCRLPTRNRDYWSAKLERNKRRDAEVNASLQADGWRILRIWEHEPIEHALATVVTALSGAERTFEE